MAKDDDDAWRAIVDNYGDRPRLDDDVATELPAPRLHEPEAQTDSQLDPQPEAEPRRAQPGWDDAYPDADWESDRFVPPPPPPLPTTTTDRLIAWGGVFGSPAVLLVCLVLGIGLPELIAYGLVLAFVGGFVYLVLTMTREPRDPDDDGAVL